MDSTQAFVEEIDFNELQFHEVVGKGAFGVVSRARWRGNNVAVKLIGTESERKAFITELKQLSRVVHPNIVKLYGACTKPPTVCLVMEYAEGGSLYNVLHGAGPQPRYTSAHAMSWAIQCARGVEYLHGMKPKALIHRDLKPPNLLLIMGGTVLKICDFGTACDIQTHMTNNKGSAAWMAPEVFEGSNYSEKCDVFSWGIILWEVFTRRKPFDEIGGPAFRIMWAVHNGTRPPPILNLPKPLELLMTRCWSGNPMERPSMSEVVRIMSHLFHFFKGEDEPLVYPNDAYNENESPDYTFSSPPVTTTGFSSTPPSTSSTSSSVPPAGDSRTGTISDTVRQALYKGEPVHVPPPIPPRATPPVVVEEEFKGQKSAPASLAASRENLVEVGHMWPPVPGPRVDPYKRYSADLGKLEEYDIMSQGSSGESQRSQKGRGHRRISSDEYFQITPCGSSSSSTPRTGSPARLVTTASPVHHVSTCPGSLSHAGLMRDIPSAHFQKENTPPQRSVSYPPPHATDAAQAERPASWTSDVSASGAAGNPGIFNTDMYAMNLVYQALDQQLQPLAPCPTNKESMAIFDQHCKLAQEYVRVQTEIALLAQRKHELMKEFEQDAQDQMSSSWVKEEYKSLKQENVSLLDFHKNLEKQVQQIRQTQQKTVRSQVPA